VEDIHLARMGIYTPNLKNVLSRYFGFPFAPTSTVEFVPDQPEPSEPKPTPGHSPPANPDGISSTSKGLTAGSDPEYRSGKYYLRQTMQQKVAEYASRLQKMTVVWPDSVRRVDLITNLPIFEPKYITEIDIVRRPLGMLVEEAMGNILRLDPSVRAKAFREWLNIYKNLPFKDKTFDRVSLIYDKEKLEEIRRNNIPIPCIQIGNDKLYKGVSRGRSDNWRLEDLKTMEPCYDRTPRGGTPHYGDVTKHRAPAAEPPRIHRAPPAPHWIMHRTLPVRDLQLLSSSAAVVRGEAKIESALPLVGETLSRIHNRSLKIVDMASNRAEIKVPSSQTLGRLALAYSEPIISSTTEVGNRQQISCANPQEVDCRFAGEAHVKLNQILGETRSVNYQARQGMLKLLKKRGDHEFEAFAPKNSGRVELWIKEMIGKDCPSEGTSFLPDYQPIVFQAEGDLMIEDLQKANKEASYYVLAKIWKKGNKSANWDEARWACGYVRNLQ
jgi:hypothetical protein